MSDDEAMRRGRDGDLYPVDVDEPDTAPHACRSGWLTPAEDGTQVPCPTCRPHTIRRSLAEQVDPAVAERDRELVRQEFEAAGITRPRRPL